MLTTVLLAFVLALSAASALVTTQTGSRWLLDKALAMVNDDTRSLDYDSAEGTLLWGMVLDNLDYRQGDNSVQVDTLELSWSPTALLARSLVIDRMVISGLDVRWQASDSPPNEEPATDPLAGILPLPVDISLRAVTLRNAVVEFAGNQQQIASLHLAASLEQHTLSLHEFALDSALLGLQGEFTAQLVPPYPLRTDLQWRWQQALPALPESAAMQPQGTLHLSGDLNSLIISHQLDAPLQMTSDGNAILDLFPSGPARAQAFSVTHQLPPQTPALANAPPDLQLRIDSAELTTTGWIDALHVTGLASLRLIDTTGASPLPTVGLSWNTVVDTEGLELQQLGASTATGSFSSSGEVRWGEGLMVDVDYSVREDDANQYQALLPAALSPGSLRSSGSISWQSSEESSAGSFAIDALQAELNGYPLSGGGSLSFGDGEYRLDGITLRSATNLLRMDGYLADEINLRWELQAPELQTLSPVLAGSVTASGIVGGTPDQPRVDMMAQGQGLSWEDIHIGRLALEGDYTQGQNNLSLNVGDLTLGGQRISTVQVTLNGQPDDHRGSVDVTSELAAGRLGFSGSLAAGESLEWRGNLQDGQLRSEFGSWGVSEAVEVLVSPEALSIAPHCWRELQGASLCLEGGRSGERLNASAHLSGLSLAMFNAPSSTRQSVEFPPTLLPRLPAGTTLEGELSADVSVAGEVTAPVVQFSVDAGSGGIIVLPPDAGALAGADVEEEQGSSPQRFDWPVARLTGSLEQGNWQASGEFTFLQPDIADTGISAQGTARTDLRLGADGALEGVVDVGLEDLGWLEAFVPQIGALDGSLQGQARISGSLAAPLVGGNLSLQASALTVPALGVQITDLDMSVLSSNGRDFDISATASSGDGYLRIDSELSDLMSDSRSLTLALNGENFELLNRPELHLTITPQLEISSSESGINASGTLLLPMVDAQPVALPESALDVSRDTVLVGQADDIEPVRNAALGDRGFLDEIPLSGQIRVVLGDNVRFSGFGLTAHLAGELDLSQRAAGTPLAYGELAVLEGNYSTYGRSLEIEHGKLLFFGSIDNPALDIRAVRETADFRVGVQMNGTLRNIRSQLFSTPTLPDGDIIAVLITGRPFAEIGNNEDSNALIGAITNLGINQSQSLTNQIRNQLGLDTLAITSGGDVTNSSLTFGKYLTPRIFLRYGLGLFETESTLAVDYTLTDRVKLEAQSGTEQSIDLTYTVER